ncbi:MAG: GNAT family N-acetyltransferase, partial [Chloroflexota bacterium]|nr:GNAT family N-acetyltransferase [Chloroflexota bacterium]
MAIDYAWRGHFGNFELDALHAEGFGHPLVAIDWESQLGRHSLGWVCAREGEELLGFVNVAWDGGIHAFILDTLVAGRAQRQGIGTELIKV